MAGHSRSKNGVASLAYVPAIHALLYCLMRGGWVYFMTTNAVTTGLDPVVHAEPPDGLPDQVRQ
jgi:hypothetical protein